MRTRSLWRPWPYAFVSGDKRVENREFEITYRGDVCWHAAKKFDQDAVPYIARTLIAGGYDVPSFVPSMHPEGVLAFVARVVDCVHLTDPAECDIVSRHRHWDDLLEKHDPIWVERQRSWAFGPWCTIVDDVRPFRQAIPWKGKQGWFDVPDAVIAGALAMGQDRS